MRTLRLTLVAMAVASVAILSAQVGTLRRANPLFDPSEFGTWRIDPDGVGSQSPFDVFAGLMHFQFDVDGNPIQWVNTGGLYCVSPLVTLAQQWGATRSENTGLSSIGLTNGQSLRLSYLVNFDLNQSIGNSGTNLLGKNAAAVQLAIWQVVVPTLTFSQSSGGDGFATGSVATLLNQSLAYANNLNRAPLGYVLFRDNPAVPNSQNLLGPGPVPPQGEPIPEPFTMALGAAALALAARKRRSKR